MFLWLIAHPMHAWVIRSRHRAFSNMNENQSVLLIPNNKEINDKDFKTIYESKYAQQRSQGAPLANLFWYFQSPGAYMHQEFMESGPQYDAIAALTRKILGIPAADIEKLISNYTQQYIDSDAITTYQLVKLFDVMMPIWTNFFYELVYTSFRQLVLGKITCYHARKLKLSEKHFKTHETADKR